MTGGGSGLGAATAQRFAAEGGRVAVTDLDGARAKAVAAELGGSVGLECDVADERSVEEAVAAAHARLGRIDCVVTSAGYVQFTPIEDLALADWNRMLAVHLTGTFLICKATLPRLRAAGGGAIVTIASASALVGRPHLAAYSAAKGGIIAFSRQLAVDAAADNVRVNVIAPGSVRTPLTAPVYADAGVENGRPTVPHAIQTRLGEPEEIAAAICFLLSHEASFFAASLVVADGGATAI